MYHVLTNGNVLASSIATSGGTVSLDTDIIRGRIEQIYVKSATVTTEFDFKIVDSKSNVLKQYTDEVGAINDCGASAYLPVNGRYTLVIENADADEAFTVKVVINEDCF